MQGDFSFGLWALRVYDLGLVALGDDGLSTSGLLGFRLWFVGFGLSGFRVVGSSREHV